MAIRIIWMHIQNLGRWKNFTGIAALHLYGYIILIYTYHEKVFNQFRFRFIMLLYKLILYIELRQNLFISAKNLVYYLDLIFLALGPTSTDRFSEEIFLFSIQLVKFILLGRLLPYSWWFHLGLGRSFTCLFWLPRCKPIQFGLWNHRYVVFSLSVIFVSEIVFKIFIINIDNIIFSTTRNLWLSPRSIRFQRLSSHFRCLKRTLVI